MTPEILFRDARFLVIDKPAALPVHEGRAGGASVEDFFPLWRRGGQGPWLAHRLDQDTAGCLVVALKKSALLAAQKCFSGGLAEKTYWAVVRGAPANDFGVVDLPLSKMTVERQWKMSADPGAGQSAITEWLVLGRGHRVTWLEFRPRTGRTHQIRAHAAALGHPVVGDAVYGGGGGKLMLLARRILLPLDPAVVAQAPVPAHMAAKLRECAWKGEHGAE